jgi:hypothetical protein
MRMVFHVEHCALQQVVDNCKPIIRGLVGAYRTTSYQ